MAAVQNLQLMVSSDAVGLTKMKNPLGDITLVATDVHPRVKCPITGMILEGAAHGAGGTLRTGTRTDQPPPTPPPSPPASRLTVSFLFAVVSSGTENGDTSASSSAAASSERPTLVDAWATE